MATWTWIPDQGAKRNVKGDSTKVNYGDQYSQTIGHGINPLIETWDLIFSNRKVAEVDSMVAFLEDHINGLSFDWTTPRGLSAKFSVDSWAEVRDEVFSVEATFTRVYEN